MENKNNLPGFVAESSFSQSNFNFYKSGETGENFTGVVVPQGIRSWFIDKAKWVLNKACNAGCAAAGATVKTDCIVAYGAGAAFGCWALGAAVSAGCKETLCG